MISQELVKPKEQTKKYSIDELRGMLKGKRWYDIADSLTNNGLVEGVHFTARIGKFLGRPAIAVCALNKIVAVRYIQSPMNRYRPNFLTGSVLTGESHTGFALLKGDFVSGRVSDIQATDLIITDET
jgi:hypothetical protein